MSQVSRFLATAARASVVCVPVLLAACGGGGDGGATANVAPAVQITSANQQAVASDAATSTTGNIGMFVLGGLTPPVVAASNLSGVVQVRTAAAASPTNPTAIAAALVHKFHQASTSGTQLAAGVTTTSTVQCTSGSGTITQTQPDPGSSTYSYSETIALTNCQTTLDSYGAVTMNGTLTISETGAETSTGSTYTADFVASNYTVQSDAFNALLNGDMHMVGSSDNTGSTETISGTQLTVSATVQQSQTLASAIVASPTVHTVSLHNYSEHYTYDNASSVTTESNDATVETNTFGTLQSYRVTTPQAVTIASGVYTAGVMKIVGANNTTLVITVTGDDTVKLERDDNGDGTVDETVTGLPASQLLPGTTLL